MLENIAEQFGARTWKITPDAKPYLHAAGVMASNNLVALLESATQIAEMGGLDKDEARRALLPLVQKSVTNISNSEKLPDALSGPVARGDSTTIAEHLKLLGQNEQLSILYKKLGEVLVRLLNEEGKLGAEKIRELTEVLNKE